MAILCLATDIEDVKRRIGNITLGWTFDDKPFTVNDLGVSGAIAALLADAIKPNLVQTTEGTPAIVHGGPFANIAHGCNSVTATREAMTFGDYTITEAGFGADLGAEKFFNIKCRKSGLCPKLTVIVATLQGLKMHGDVPLEKITLPDAEGVRKGFANLDRHVRNMKGFGQTVLVVLNRFASDTQEEIALVEEHCRQTGVHFAVNDAYARGGDGAVELASKVVDIIEKYPSGPVVFTYPDEAGTAEKITAVAKGIYGAGSVSFSNRSLKKLERIKAAGMDRYPVCIAKTQYSFSQDPKRYGAPEGFDFEINDIVINSGAGMTVAIAGDIIRMPGLPKSPQALKIDIVDGQIDGLS